MTGYCAPRIRVISDARLSCADTVAVPGYCAQAWVELVRCQTDFYATRWLVLVEDPGAAGEDEGDEARRHEGDQQQHDAVRPHEVPDPPGAEDDERAVRNNPVSAMVRRRSRSMRDRVYAGLSASTRPAASAAGRARRARWAGAWKHRRGEGGR